MRPATLSPKPKIQDQPSHTAQPLACELAAREKLSHRGKRPVVLAATSGFRVYIGWLWGFRVGILGFRVLLDLVSERYAGGQPEAVRGFINDLNNLAGNTM